MIRRPKRFTWKTRLRYLLCCLAAIYFLTAPVWVRVHGGEMTFLDKLISFGVFVLSCLALFFLPPRSLLDLTGGEHTPLSLRGRIKLVLLLITFVVIITATNLYLTLDTYALGTLLESFRMVVLNS